MISEWYSGVNPVCRRRDPVTWLMSASNRTVVKILMVGFMDKHVTVIFYIFWWFLHVWKHKLKKKISYFIIQQIKNRIQSGMPAFLSLSFGIVNVIINSKRSVLVKCHNAFVHNTMKANTVVCNLLETLYIFQLMSGWIACTSASVWTIWCPLETSSPKACHRKTKERLWSKKPNQAKHRRKVSHICI